jgi:hypothetical protein
MKSSWLLLLNLCLVINIVFGVTPPPNHVVLNERQKHIDADSAWLDKTGQNVERVSLDASDKEKVFVNLINHNKQLSASSHGNSAGAQIGDGERAQVQRFGEKGGLAQAGGHKYLIFIWDFYDIFNLERNCDWKTRAKNVMHI